MTMSINTGDSVTSLTNSDFEDFIKTNHVVVVAFVLPWQGSTYTRFMAEYEKVCTGTLTCVVSYNS